MPELNPSNEDLVLITLYALGANARPTAPALNTDDLFDALSYLANEFNPELFSAFASSDAKRVAANTLAPLGTHHFIAHPTLAVTSKGAKHLEDFPLLTESITVAITLRDLLVNFSPAPTV